MTVDVQENSDTQKKTTGYENIGLIAALCGVLSLRALFGMYFRDCYLAYFLVAGVPIFLTPKKNVRESDTGAWLFECILETFGAITIGCILCEVLGLNSLPV